MSTLTIRLENKPEVGHDLEEVKRIFGEKSATSAIFKALEYASNKKHHESALSKLKFENESLRDNVETIKELIKERDQIEKRIKEFLEK